jgi:hypothetical protein
MKKYLNLARAIVASLKPKSDRPEIDTYGEPTLTYEQQEELMTWLFASLFEVKYVGKAHLLWDDGETDWEEMLTAVMRDEPLFLYRQGDRPSAPAAECCWRLMEHPSLRVYQLEGEEG